MLAAPKDNLNCTRQTSTERVLKTAEIPFKRFDLAESHCIICTLTITTKGILGNVISKHFPSLTSCEWSLHKSMFYKSFSVLSNCLSCASRWSLYSC